MKLLILATRDVYREKLAIFAQACEAHRITVDTVTALPNDIVTYVQEHAYDAVLHRNEHGRLFADGTLQAIAALVKAKIPALSLDFGYFAHYKTFMLDYYIPHEDGLRSSIYNEWDSLPTKVDWSKAPAYLQDYRNDVFQRISRADNSKYAGKVAIWMQWNAKLLRKEIGACSQAEWLNKAITLVRAQGKEPIIKHNNVIHSELYNQTVPLIDPSVAILCEREKLRLRSPRLTYDKFANWNLVAGCDYHIAICSSVTNILALAKKPVITMGQSWFNALDIFEEPLTFPTSIEKPKIHNTAREKWMNWWLSRQALFQDIPALLPSLIAKARAGTVPLVGELWKYEHIYSNPASFPNYGGSMHGKKALPLLLDLAPASLLDVGCGTNNFIPFLKTHLPNLTAIGVDPCSPQADVKATAQQLPFKNKEFELLTSFDVLEHIVEAEIPDTLKELSRVSQSFLFRIAKKDSRLTVQNQTLHPTVKPTSWWRAQLQPLAATVQEQSGYLFGHWKAR